MFVISGPSTETNSEVMLLNDPTRGVDYPTRLALFAAFEELATEASLGLVVLSDPPTDPTPARGEERCTANDLCVPTDYACERATPTVCAP